MSISLVDTHAHLDMIQDNASIDEVLARAKAQGVSRVISVGIDIASSSRSVQYTQFFPQVFAATGLHPNDASGFDDMSLSRLRELAASPGVVAWGEIGLDYYRDHTPRDVQKAAFEAQLHAASSMGLPVIIHDREAHEDCLAILRNFSRKSGISGVFHCFSGDTAMAEKVLDLGFFISFTGVITFPKAQDLTDVAKFVPFDRMLIETDSPFLSPVPFRGKPNEPARVRIVAERLADIRNVPTEEIARCTTENAEALFGLKSP